MTTHHARTLTCALGCAALLAGALGGCKRPARPAPTPDRGAAPPDTRPPPKPDLWPPASRLGQSLGAPALSCLRGPQTVWTAPLRREAALQAAQATFESERRMVGYPVAASPRQLSAEQIHKVSRLLTDDASYLFDGPVNRCANRSWLGLRFLASGTTVELALGKPCDQILFAWTRPEKKRWGTRMAAAAAHQLRGLLAPAE